MLRLFNTLARRVEPFQPLEDNLVRLYACGPTVYGPAHLGNLRTYIFEDVLKRVLLADGFRLKHVMNITDVGHLTSDADEGEDKIEAAARKERKTSRQIADEYTQRFQDDLKKLNILPPDVWCRATDYIEEQIALVKKLEERGFTYRISDGVYFDTSKFPSYGKLAQLEKQKLKAGARVAVNLEKRQPRDFALWKLTPKGVARQMEWDSPWGKGFPGWHLECSAMAMKILGETIDIHCGGIDHIPTHHTNEIAQSEAVTGKPFSRFWLHGEFLILPDARMGKSEGNIVTLDELAKRGFTPLAFRYFCLTAHYRSKLTFSWKAVESAQSGLNNLYDRVREMTDEPKVGCAEFEERFSHEVNNDLDTPKTLAIVWELLKSDYPDHAKKRSLLKFDEVLGLGLAELKPDIIEVPTEIRKLVEEREKLRLAGDFEKADEIRSVSAQKGYEIEDTPKGPRVKRKRRANS